VERGRGAGEIDTLGVHHRVGEDEGPTGEKSAGSAPLGQLRSERERKRNE
jgi:hypothetical protein